MKIIESQKDLNKQIEIHKARQSEIAQGMHNSLLRLGLLSLIWHPACRISWYRMLILM
jgi:hypothetical protein